MATERLRVVLCWHMHQPEYRNPIGGRTLAPWVYLHALKDYADMAAHLEANPAACAVVNFTPVLLDQLDACAQRLNGVCRGVGAVGDLLLDTLAQTVLTLGTDERRQVVAACLRAQRHRLMDRFPAYRRLVDIAELALAQRDAFDYLDDGFVFDLLVWYHLAWLGESVRRRDRRAAALIEKERRFDGHDRMSLLELTRDVLVALLGRYRALAAQGRIELATTPWAHPILPLLLDFGSAREARHALPLPAMAGYPGGARRVDRQLRDALTTHRRVFGDTPAGCWSSEAAVSSASLRHIGAAGFGWTVSSQTVLRHSLPLHAPGSELLHRPYRQHDDGPAVFFRDDELSDRIGFVYKDWRAEDAVADLLGRLAAIAAEPAGPGRVVAIALDGENAWEHYEANGQDFLRGLYAELANHPALAVTTFGRCLADPGVPLQRLDRLVAGSWVGGDLCTWIGSRGKNRAWDMLVEAKHQYDRLDGEDDPAIARQLAVCEGSDWFWWPDGHHPAAEVSRFERMYRMHLAGLYRLLGCDAPDYLGHPFTHGAEHVTEVVTMLPHHPP